MERQSQQRKDINKNQREIFKPKNITTKNIQTLPEQTQYQNESDKGKNQRTERHHHI